MCSIESLANVCADMGYFPYLELFSFWETRIGKKQLDLRQFASVFLPIIQLEIRPNRTESYFNSDKVSQKSAKTKKAS